MINQAKAVKLIKIYQYVCDKYEEELQYHCQRFTNNNRPEFTDQEKIQAKSVTWLFGLLRRPTLKN
jgi:hypothetical protein